MFLPQWFNLKNICSINLILLKLFTGNLLKRRKYNILSSSCWRFNPNCTLKELLRLYKEVFKEENVLKTPWRALLLSVLLSWISFSYRCYAICLHKFLINVSSFFFFLILFVVYTCCFLFSNNINYICIGLPSNKQDFCVFKAFVKLKFICTSAKLISQIFSSILYTYTLVLNGTNSVKTFIL